MPSLSLATHIFLRLLLPILLAIVGIGCISIVPLVTTSRSISQQVSGQMTTSSVLITDTMIHSSNRYISQLLRQVENDLNTIHAYTDSMFRQKYPIDKFYQSYATYATTPPVDSSSRSLASTVFILPQYIGSDTANLVNVTSTLDNVFRSIMLSSPTYAKVYIGLNNGLFRRYPYADLTSYYTLSYQCIPTGLTVSGYDPRCRVWYHQAIGQSTIQYTNPYIDAFSGSMHISASRAVYDSANHLQGVVSVDFSMSEIDRVTDGTNNFVQGSYNFVIDNTGLTISYPGLNRLIVNPSIISMENSISYQVWTSVLASSDSLVRTVPFVKNNQPHELKYIAINSKYILCTIYPTSGLHYLADEMAEEFTSLINRGIVGISVTYACLLIITMVLARCIAGRYTVPLEQMSDFLSNASHANKDVEMACMAPISSEINVLRDNLKNLLSAINAGNEAYYQGDLNKALANYDIGLKLFTERKNNRGLAVCTNNKANVLKQLGRCKDAISMYEQSIRHINDISGKDRDTDACKIMVANRLMNIGVVLNDMDLMVPAMERLDQSLALHVETNNLIGIVKVKNNISLMLLKQNRIVEAETLIDSTYRAVKDKHDVISLQYACMAKGILEFTKKNYQPAVEWLTHVLCSFQETNVYIQQTCMNYLEQTYIVTGEMDRLNDFRKTYSSDGITSGLSRGVKHVKFVLDCSGSMGGRFIEQCRSSIIDIITQYTNDQDLVTLVTFSDTRKVCFADVLKYQNINAMIDAVSDPILTRADGGTAFYDALHYVISTGSVNPLGKSAMDQWIIALTDGDDNRSSCTSRSVVQCLESKDINLVVITVGQLKNNRDIEAICHPSKSCKRIHINAATNPNGIAQAFTRAARLMAGQLNVDSL
jgi:tetratricopeptide (TPR) repeat protein